MTKYQLQAIPAFAIMGAALAFASAAPAQGQTMYKLQFASGQLAAGYTQVASTAAYDAAAGYGFERDSTLNADKPFYFSVKVPEGNYKVTVTLGGPAAATTTVKAELRRLMLEQVSTAAGQSVTRSFVVNVRTSKIAGGGGEVHLKVPRETTAEAWAWDDKLTLEFNGQHPSVQRLSVEKVDVPTVFLLGDSTVCDQSGEPYASWGQMLPRFFGLGAAVSNQAESGETVIGSAHALRFAKVLSQMKPGDYLLMQFGHNDMKSSSPDASTQYQNMLKSWVEQVKAKGGVPVLVTPVNRHTFEGTVVTNSLRDYPDKVRELAKSEGVALIDLNAMTKTLYEALGPDGSIPLFAPSPPGKYDHTHHSPYGAYEIAKCVVAGIRADKLGLAQYLSEEAQPFDPQHPDSPTSFAVPPSPTGNAQKPLGS